MHVPKKMTKTGTTKKASKPSVTGKAAAHILSAPKGPRSVTHDQIKKAVAKVFRERHSADA
jgi:hypothetical protein